MMSRAPSHAVALLIASSVVATACSRPRPVATVAPARADSARAAQPAVPAARAARPLTTADDPFQSIFRMDLPAAGVHRTASGKPGPQYWQQRADYTIAATLDTTTQTVSGTVAIRYTNNAPDTLRVLWLLAEQNLYRPGSQGSAMNPPDSRWGVRGFQGGIDLGDVAVNGRAVTPFVDDTRVRLDVSETPVAARGGVATITMGFSFRVPEHGSDRMGRDGALYEIAQWYPRMAVYDDVRGWNADPYLGQSEFYLEYGDFDVTITAPAGYTVAATGTLQNEGEVLTSGQRARLAQARQSDTVIAVVPAAEAGARVIAGTRSWRFSALNVRDFAWAGAPDFRWDATSWDGILIQAFYQPQKTGGAWASAAEQTQWSVRTYSQLFHRYPWPQATSVAGPVGGMEYPMFVMVHYGRDDDPNSVFGTLDHEHGHEWFPMMVGSNERRYAWMDEGINTYINTFSRERRYPGQDVLQGYMANWRQVVAAGLDEPLMTRPDHMDRAALGALGYRKPAVVLLTLRNHVVGPESFDLALREYVRRWAFRHPTPADFFRTVEDVTGQDLSWFWRSFFYTADVLDVAVGPVTMRDTSGLRIAVVPLRMVTPVPFPVVMRLKLADGSIRDVRLPVDIWAGGRSFAAELQVSAAVTGVRLWPSGTVPDWDPSNDVWGDAPAANPPGPVTAGGLSGPVGPG